MARKEDEVKNLGERGRNSHFTISLSNVERLFHSDINAVESLS